MTIEQDDKDEEAIAAVGNVADALITLRTGVEYGL